MNELETLKLEHSGLKTFSLADSAALNLKNLFLSGNPIDCDCHARWLWNLSRSFVNNNNSNNNGSSSGSDKNNSSDSGRGTNVDNDNPETRLLKILEVPACTTPFSVKNLRLENLEGK